MGIINPKALKILAKSMARKKSSIKDIKPINPVHISKDPNKGHVRFGGYKVGRLKYWDFGKKTRQEFIDKHAVKYMGAVDFNKELPNEFYHYHIRDLFIDPSKRGLDMGSHALQTFFQNRKKPAVVTLFASADEWGKQSDLIRFYERNGFKFATYDVPQTVVNDKNRLAAYKGDMGIAIIK
jgi:hypothetical protein